MPHHQHDYHITTTTTDGMPLHDPLTMEYYTYHLRRRPPPPFITYPHDHDHNHCTPHPPIKAPPSRPYTPTTNHDAAPHKTPPPP